MRDEERCTLIGIIREAQPHEGSVGLRRKGRERGREKEIELRFGSS